MKVAYDLNDKIGWYEITKDIIIPLLGVLSTLIIGIVITNLLRKKEEKSKIKELLINHYMDYLEARNRSLEFEVAYCAYEVFNKILINHSFYFSRNSNPQIAFDVVRSKAEKLGLDAEALREKAIDWSLFPQRFAFLLGKKYSEEVYKLEHIVNALIFNEDNRRNFINKMLDEIKQDEKIIKGLNSIDMFAIEVSIHLIHEQIRKQYYKYQFTYFNPYNQTISYLINNY